MSPQRLRKVIINTLKELEYQKDNYRFIIDEDSTRKLIDAYILFADTIGLTERTWVYLLNLKSKDLNEVICSISFIRALIQDETKILTKDEKADREVALFIDNFLDTSSKKDVKFQNLKVLRKELNRIVDSKIILLVQPKGG